MAPFPPPPLAASPDCATADASAKPPLVAVIELKWLAAGVGQHLHVERMLADPGYAKAVLDAAESSSSAPLRRAAARLRALMAPGAC